MIKKSIKILLIILVLAFNIFAFDGSIEDGWKGIKLFRTNMATVEKILGEPKASSDNAYNYETNEFFIQVRYSSALCGAGRYGGGEYDVPLDTVISYNVILDNPIKLTDFKFKKERYRREDDPHRTNIFYYHNSQDGVSISIGIINGIEYVGRIRFYPSSADEKKFECKKPEATIEKPQNPKIAEKPKCEKPK